MERTSSLDGDARGDVALDLLGRLAPNAPNGGIAETAETVPPLRERRRRGSDMVGELALAISRSPTVENAFEVILRRFCETCGWVVGQVWVPDQSGFRLECSPVWYEREAGHEVFRHASAALTFTRGVGLLGGVWSTRRARWSSDVVAEPDLFRRADAARRVGLAAALAVPVLANDDVVAVLELLTSEPRTAEDDLIDVVSTVAAQLGSLIRQKQVEDQLRRSEAHFRAVADTAQDAIVSVDHQGVITYFNARVAELFGYEEHELVGEAVSLLIPERFRDAHQEGFARYLAMGEGRIVGGPAELWARRRDGYEIPIELSLAPWRADGSTYFTAIIRDITERKRVTKELEAALDLERQAAARLRELDELKTMFLDAVSHELRSPLALLRAVGAVLELDAEQGTLSSERRRGYLNELGLNVMKMTGLLDDLLDLDRLSSGQVDVQRRPADLTTLVRCVVGDNAAVLDGRVVELDLDPVVLDVDAAMVERIVENLITNAARHTPAASPLWVLLRRQPDGVLLGVDDAGAGVTEEIREAIFERFRRAPGAPPAGLGIGLSLVARMAELHGGRAWVEDRPGGGAAFRVLLAGSFDR